MPGMCSLVQPDALPGYARPRRVCFESALYLCSAVFHKCLYVKCILNVYIRMYVNVCVCVCFVAGIVQGLLGPVSTNRLTQMTESARGIDTQVRMAAHLRTELASTSGRRKGVIGVDERRVTPMAIRTAGQLPLEEDLHRGGGLPPLQGGTRLVLLPSPLTGGNLDHHP